MQNYLGTMGMNQAVQLRSRSKECQQTSLIAGKRRWLRHQPAARLSALNLGVLRFIGRGGH